MKELEQGYQFTKDQLAELEELRKEVSRRITIEEHQALCAAAGRVAVAHVGKHYAPLIQQYGELQEAARKVIRYWGVRHESYLKEYIGHMDSVIQKHIMEAQRD